MTGEVLDPRGALRGLLLAAGIVGVWLALAPATPDLAAQIYRVHLFANHGFALYDANWYGGHLLPAYSVLFPPLGALVGVRVAGALATAAAIVLFDRLARAEFGARAWRGTVWFALGAGMNLLSARLTFALGLALGLGALLAARRQRQIPAVALAFACPLASPLAGLFLAGAAAAWALGARRVAPAVLVAASLAPLLALQIAFPEGGTFPFSATELILLLTALVGGIVVLGPQQRVLRIGFAIYALVAIAAFLVPSPLGSNCGRLALIAVGPLLACALSGRRALLLAAVAPLMLFWSWAPSAQDLESVGEASSSASYFAPLESFLARHDQPPARVEIPFTKGHWEAVYVARRFMLARGWERQLDRGENPIFYPDRRRALDPATYLRWLHAGGVRFVAVPDAPLDESARSEVALISSEPPYLDRVWRSSHWTVYAVRAATPLLSGPGELLSVRPDSFTLDAKRPGSFLMRLHFSPYWQLRSKSGCVMRGPGGWTRLQLTHTGTQQVTTDFGLDRTFSHGRRCA